MREIIKTAGEKVEFITKLIDFATFNDYASLEELINSKGNFLNHLKVL